MSAEYNGTSDAADEGWSSGVHDLNIFYDVGSLAFVLHPDTNSPRPET